VARLAERARAESWTHGEFLVACLQREVSARDSHGGEGRIRAARFPARRSIEEFDFEHARGLIVPGLSQVIPEGATHQDLTVQGGPAVGLEYLDDTGQRGSVLVTVIGDVVVRVWGCGREPTPLVAAAQSLVLLP